MIVKNLLGRHLSGDESKCLNGVADLAEWGFGKKIHTVTVTADKVDDSVAFGLMVSFDRESRGEE